VTVRGHARRHRAWALALALALGVSPGCKKPPPPPARDAPPITGVSTASLSDAAAPRPGMAYVASGSLRAGTPADRVPRVADEEPPGSAVAMQGFYIDQLPFPNEPGAIPTTNVTRDEAEALCAGKGKRLCSELEWERACKGEAGTTYEYGDTYRAAACGTGSTAEEAARRPSGELAQCKSSFGVADMHGGVWQWTSSTWGRGTADGSLGVLRGGNAVAGELVGRCANAIGRPASKKSPTMGFRCCAGPRNEAEVQLHRRGTPGLSLARTEEVAAMLSGALGEGVHAARAYRWTPVSNDALVILLGCSRSSQPTCVVVTGRPAGQAGQAGQADGDAGASAAVVIGREAVGLVLPDLVRNGDAGHLRLRGIDSLGTFSREVTYVYGRVDFGPMKRP
jgi:hypothetical protein